MKKNIVLALVIMISVLTIATGSISNIWFVTDSDANNKVIAVKTKDGCFVEDYTAEVGGVTIVAEAGTSFANYKVVKECVLDTPNNFRKYITDITLIAESNDDSFIAREIGSFETGSFTASILIKDPQLVNNGYGQIVYSSSEESYWHEVGHIVSYACSLYNNMDLAKDSDGFDDVCDELWRDRGENFNCIEYTFQWLATSETQDSKEETWAEAFGIYMSGEDNGTTGWNWIDYNDFIENYPVTCEYIENYLDEIGWYDE